MKVQIALCAVVLAIAPVVAATAQQSTGPELKADSKSEAHDVAKGSGANPTTPGATGSTVVPGSHSTVAGDQQNTNSRGPGGGGGTGNK